MSDRGSEQTASYVELANKTYTTLVDAVSDANHRALAFGKSWLDLVTKPYAATSVEAAYRERLERANQLVDLTIETAQHAGTQAAKLGNQLAQHSSDWQTSVTQTMRGVMQTGASNLKYVGDAAGEAFNGVTKRVQDLAAQSTPVVAGTVKKN